MTIIRRRGRPRLAADAELGQRLALYLEGVGGAAPAAEILDVLAADGPLVGKGRRTRRRYLDCVAAAPDAPIDIDPGSGEGGRGPGLVKLRRVLLARFGCGSAARQISLDSARPKGGTV